MEGWKRRFSKTLTSLFTCCLRGKVKISNLTLHTTLLLYCSDGFQLDCLPGLNVALFYLYCEESNSLPWPWWQKRIFLICFRGQVWTVENALKTLVWTQIFLCVFNKMKTKVFENVSVWTWPKRNNGIWGREWRSSCLATQKTDFTCTPLKVTGIKSVRKNSKEAIRLKTDHIPDIWSKHFKRNL